jgi:hypothetical protein
MRGLGGQDGGQRGPKGANIRDYIKIGETIGGFVSLLF